MDPGASRSRAQGSDADDLLRLDFAVEHFARVLATTATDDPQRPLHLSKLCVALQRRFDRTGAIEDLDQAITMGRQAVESIPADHPHRSTYLSNLGGALQRRFERTGLLENLDDAITVDRQAVESIPADHPHRPVCLSTLGVALMRRFESTGLLEDLNQAITVDRQAADTIPFDHPHRPACLSNLGAALLRGFESTGQLEDLDEAITLGLQAVESIPADHPHRPACLSTLGLALQRRFERTGLLENLDDALTADRQAVESVPADHPHRPTCLSNLGLALQSQFERTGLLENLDEAITVDRQAVNATPSEHPERPTFLSNLGLALMRRFERTEVLDDLEEAITTGRQAVDATATDHPHRPACLSTLGLALQRRFDRAGVLEDLDQAITMGRQAVESVPADHPNRPTCLSNLGVALMRRFERTGVLEELDEAITVGQQAVESMPVDHPNRPLFQCPLADALRARFERAKDASDLERALEAFREATAVNSAAADARAYAARGWGQCAVVAQNWAEAVLGYQTAVGLVGLLASRELARSDQEFRLWRLAGLGPEAAAVCVQAGHPGLAVELFEHGRAVLFSQVIAARSDLTDLQQADPQLAEEFARCRDLLDRPDPDPFAVSTSDLGPGTASMLAAQRRRHAAAEFDEVLTEIRALPGFEGFLTPPRVAELLPAAAEGPVVLVNIAPMRCDALILSPSGVEVLALPELGPDVVAKQVITFMDALDTVHDRASSPAARTASEQVLREVLGWLGDRITSPILDHLGYTCTRPEIAQGPRVWWCPSGLLSLLPLHAAGHHALSRTTSDAVIDRVISSTIPAVRALLHTRPTPPFGGQPRVLVVAMPHTPSQADLPGVAAELATVQTLLDGRVDVLGLPDTAPANYATVTAALPEYAWVHFSCHGASDLDDPSASFLMLDDYQERRLTVVDLTHARLQGVELAFLSACTTARTGIALPDEPIHLAAACQLAGYRHVVASLWPVSDYHTAWLTAKFYTTMTLSWPSCEMAATALHDAIRELRANNRDHPSRWAPYTHTGP